MLNGSINRCASLMGDAYIKASNGRDASPIVTDKRSALSIGVGNTKTGPTGDAFIIANHYHNLESSNGGAHYITTLM